METPIEELTALVALIRGICGLDEIRTRHSERMRRIFRNRIFCLQACAGEKISQEMMRWLRIIRARPVASFVIEHDVLDPVSFNVHGGLGKMP